MYQHHNYFTTGTSSITCEKCKIRIPKNRPLLVCSMCLEYKHYKCNNLSKNEAYDILVTDYAQNWACQSCMHDVFPLGLLQDINQFSHVNIPNLSDYDPNCTVCDKPCNQSNGSLCNWCDQVCHKYCANNSLGCSNCTKSMIPGFSCLHHELYNESLLKNNSIFNPYDHNALANLIGNHLDTEDGLENTFMHEISNKLHNCNYTQFKDVKQAKQNELKVMSLNIRSLKNGIDSLRDNISHYAKFDILCFNETNCDIATLPNGIDDVLLDGFYPPLTQKPYRASNKGGGLAIYVNERVCDDSNLELLDIKLEPDAELSCEYMFLKISLATTNGTKSYIIGNLYRSPSTKPTVFIQRLEKILAKLDRHKNKSIILVGDLNIDLIKHNTDKNGQELIDLTTSQGFLQVISRPTRITDHSATLIDHIFVNKIHDVYSSGIITCDISDHLCTYVNIALNENLNHNLTRSGAEFAKFNDANNEKFRELINNETWEPVYSQPCAQSQYTKFIEIYTKHYNSAFPKTNNNKKRRKNPKPWILPWLEDACSRKNNLYYVYIHDRSMENKMKYEKMKKFVKKHIRLAKNKYYRQFFEQHSSNSKKQWQMINSLLNRHVRKSSNLKLKDSEGNVISDPLQVAKKFNCYFTNIAKKLKNESGLGTGTGPSLTRINCNLGDPVARSIILAPTSPFEIGNIINALKLKSTSDTKICAIKTASLTNNFNLVLANIVNSSFASGIFPAELKAAKVVPIHKEGSKSEVSNYRPISLLSSFSKIFEKAMYARLINFLNSNNTLTESQYGFRAGRSCEHALLDAQNDILSALSKKQISLLLLIDFSKAFDTVDHTILLHKLKHYGVRGVAHDWLKSYLSNRTQYVCINNKFSDSQKLDYGVPQGSILGPLLFIVYINDIPNISHIAKFVLYADDANIIISGDNIKDIENKLHTLSNSLIEWVNVNELLLNVKKTKYMIFSRSKNREFPSLNPKLNGIPIERKQVVRFLGVLVDEKLSWNNHVTALKAKMSRYIGIMYKLRHILPAKARANIFNSLVQSHLNYCSLIWGSTCHSNIDSLFTTQKKAMRATMPGHVNYFYKDGELPTHTKPGFTSLNILTVHNVILKNMLIYINNFFNFPGSLPLNVRLCLPDNIPVPNTPPDNWMLWYTEYNSIPYNKTIFFKAPLLYYHLMSKNVQLQCNLIKTRDAYKQRVKLYLLSIQCDGDKEEWSNDNFKLVQVKGLRHSNRLHNVKQINL